MSNNLIIRRGFPWPRYTRKQWRYYSNLGPIIPTRFTQNPIQTVLELRHYADLECAGLFICIIGHRKL